MKTMQLLITDVDDSAGKRQFQAYYCSECDEIRWCQPGKPECWTGPDAEEHELTQTWVEQ